MLHAAGDAAHDIDRLMAAVLSDIEHVALPVVFRIEKHMERAVSGKFPNGDRISFLFCEVDHASGFAERDRRDEALPAGRPDRIIQRHIDRAALCDVHVKLLRPEDHIFQRSIGVVVHTAFVRRTIQLEIDRAFVSGQHVAFKDRTVYTRNFDMTSLPIQSVQISAFFLIDAAFPGDDIAVDARRFI